MRVATLYYGDNGLHEFWESEDSNVLMWRNHKETFWVANVDGAMVEDKNATKEAQLKDRAVTSVLLTTPTADDMVAKLLEHKKVKITLDRSRKFKKNSRGDRMRLVKAG